MKPRLLQVALVASAVSSVAALTGCSAVGVDHGLSGATGGAEGAGGTGGGTPGVGGTGGTMGTGGTGAGETGGFGSPSTALITSSPGIMGRFPCYANVLYFPPDPVFLIVSSYPVSCADPQAPGVEDSISDPAKAMVWELCVAFPSSAVGTGTIEIPAPGDTPGVTGYETAAASGDSAGVLVHGPASITFAAVESTHLSVSVQGTNGLLFFDGYPVEPDGIYEAMRCP